MVRLKGSDKLKKKISMTLSGLEPATFRLVAAVITIIIVVVVVAIVVVKMPCFSIMTVRALILSFFLFLLILY
jgi:hypothetical protein